MGLLNLIPGYTAVSHIVSNIGKGFREEGLIGALKVVGKGLSEDWALGIAACFIPGGQVLAGATLAAAGGDLLGVFDLKSEKAAKAAEEQGGALPQGA